MSDNIIKPLVSVCVFTYNSSSTILETLSSIYEQSYKEIELIISDDFSLDNTINVSKEEVENYYNGIYSDNVKKIIIAQDKLKDRIAVIQNKFNELYLADNPDVDLSKVNRSNKPYVEI